MTPNTWRAAGFNKTSEETTCWNSSEILNKVLRVTINLRTIIKVLKGLKIAFHLLSTTYFWVYTMLLSAIYFLSL